MEYEKTLKKLINILRIKSSDNVKQIEDLWESLSSLSAPKGPVTRTANSRPDDDNSNDSLTSNQSSKSSKRTLNDSTSHVKKLKPSNSPPAPKTVATSSINLTARKNNSTVSLSALGATKAKKHFLDSEMESASSGSSSNKKLRSALSSQNEWSNSSTGSSVSRSASSSPTDDIEFDGNSDGHDDHRLGDGNDDGDKYASTTKIYEYVIEMGLTCDMCKLLTQETNNKLVECQECKRMFHQQCHRPSISNEEISDPRKLWYCSKCIKSVRSFAAKNSKATLKFSQPDSTKIHNGTSSGKLNNSLNSQSNVNAKKLSSASINTTNYFNVSHKALTPLQNSSTPGSAL